MVLNCHLLARDDNGLRQETTVASDDSFYSTFFHQEEDQHSIPGFLLQCMLVGGVDVVMPPSANLDQYSFVIVLVLA